MGALHIRDAGIDDAANVAVIHCASWRSAYAGILEQSFLDGPIETDRAALWNDRFINSKPCLVFGILRFDIINLVKSFDSCMDCLVDVWQ